MATRNLAESGERATLTTLLFMWLCPKLSYSNKECVEDVIVLPGDGAAAFTHEWGYTAELRR